MKYLISSLVVLLVLACARLYTERPYNTLEVFNNSGHVVQIFINDGMVHRLRRVYPGRECIRIYPTTATSLAFGIRHVGEPTEWMPFELSGGINVGWQMEINQAIQVRYDLLSVMPTERC